jgi:DNA gyrase subunit A
MATSMGTVKKPSLPEFSIPRKAGIIAVDLDPGDYLIGAELTTGQSDIVLVSDAGKAVWFGEDQVRPMGRQSRGVRGMSLQEGQQVIALLVAENEDQTVLVATENGYGKRTRLGDFRRSGRGTQGVMAIAASERNGKVVAAKLVTDEDEVMLITTGGVLIRTRVAEIRELGRATQGVTLIALDAGEKLSGLEKVAETGEDEGGPDANAEAEAADTSHQEAAPDGGESEV